MTCLRCGAAVIIDPTDPIAAETIHNNWHLENDRSKTP